MYPLSRYIEQHLSFDLSGESAEASAMLSKWLGDPEWTQMTVLGDVGTGKSFLARVIAHRVAEAHLKDPGNKPFPFLIDLRSAEREFSLEGLILTHAARFGLPRLSFDTFMHLASAGRIVVIYDGFDEMAARVTSQTTVRNFNELVRAAQGRAKVVLTCRTHYFRSRSEEQQVILGKDVDYKTDAAKELYWDLIARSGFRVCYLLPFTISQIERYVTKARPDDAQSSLQRIRSTYNLMELSQRPMLLEMIVKSIDRLRDKQIDPSTLYEVFTDAWIHRDRWRDVLAPHQKRGLLTAFALSAWASEAATMHYSKLGALISSHLGQEVEPQDIVHIDNELRTASFLVRDVEGNYGFAHKSYAEFFVARHAANELIEGRLEFLSQKRITPEVLHFLVEMVTLESVGALLDSVLRDAYRPNVSENALILRCALARRSGQSLATLPLHGSAALAGADLRETILEEVPFTAAKLDGSSFADAVLRGSTFDSASLVGVKFDGADLRDVVFRAANLTGASFDGANVDGADFSNAQLSDVTFYGSYLGQAVLTIQREGVLGAENDSPGAWSQVIPDDSARDEFWQSLAEVLPRLERYALRNIGRAYVGNVEAADVAHEVVIRLASPGLRDRYLARDPRGRMLLAVDQLGKVINEKWRGREVAAGALGIEIDDSFDFASSQSGELMTGDFDEAATPAFQHLVYRELASKLSPQALRVLELYLEGYSVAEISIRMEQSRNFVHRTLRTIRRHLSQ